MSDAAQHAGPGPDLRLALPAVGVWAGSLVGLSVPVRITALVATAVVGAGLVVLALRRNMSTASLLRRPLVGWLVVAVAAASAAGWVSASVRVHTLRSGPVAALARDGAVVTAEIVVASDPQPVRSRVVGSARTAARVVCVARLERVTGRGSTVTTHEPVLLVAPAAGWADLLPSQRLRVSGRLRPADSGDDVAAVLSARGPPERVGQPSLVQRVAGHLRAGLRRAADGLPEAEAGLVAGLVDGDTSALPDEVAEQFRSAGMTHLVAVSGANLAVVAVALVTAARWVGLRSYALPAAAAAGVLGFVVLARPEPSVVRAAVMALLVAGSVVRGGLAAGALPALAGAVMVLLLADPFLARSPGFALSVLATLGLLALAPGWRERLRTRLPRRVADVLAVATAAQVAAAPVLALIAPQLSLVAIPANVFAEPAVPAATVLGVAVAVVAPLWPAGAAVLAHLAAVPAWWLATVADHAAELPLATVSWPQGLLGALLAVLVPALGRLAWPSVRRHPRLAAGVAVAVVALVVAPVPRPGREAWPPAGWVMVSCDVGQGDAAVVADGPGTALVVDAGPDPRAADRCLRDLGISRVSLLVLTHFHADHVEGVPGVLRGRSVSEVETTPLADPADEAGRVRTWTIRANVPQSAAVVGEQRSEGGVTWTVLWPRRIIESGSVPNNASVVLRVVTHGLTLLLTGDVEPAAQAALLDDPSLLRADVLKVPHHGSANQDPEFVRAVGAGVALVSVGAGNPYGHPAASTLDLLRSLGARVERTDQDGDVAVVAADGGVQVVPRHPP